MRIDLFVMGTHSRCECGHEFKPGDRIVVFSRHEYEGEERKELCLKCARVYLEHKREKNILYLKEIEKAERPETSEMQEFLRVFVARRDNDEH